MAKNASFEKTEEFWRYLEIVYDLCSKNRIFIKSWKKTDEGKAFLKEEGQHEIQIPPPFNDFNMMICLHEIGHCLTTKGIMRTVRSEYHACLYSEEMCRQYNVPLPPEHIKDNQNYVLHHLCKEIQKGKVSIQSLDPQIAAYIGINKADWVIKINSGLTPYLVVNGPRWQNCDILWMEGKIS